MIFDAPAVHLGKNAMLYKHIDGGKTLSCIVYKCHTIIYATWIFDCMYTICTSIERLESVTQKSDPMIDNRGLTDKVTCFGRFAPINITYL